MKSLATTAVARAATGVSALRTALRTTPYDTSTEEGRAQERVRRATLSTLTNLLAHTLGIVTGLLSLRLTVSYLGRERYGVWMAINAVFTWAALAELGTGAGLINQLTAADGRGDQEAATRLVSGAFAGLSVVALVMLVLLVPAILYVPWPTVLHVTSPELAAETRDVVAAVGIVFLARLPVMHIGAIFASYQLSFVMGLFGIGGSLLSLGTILVVTHLQLGLPWLVVSTGGLGIVTGLAAMAWLVRKLPHVRPRFGSLEWATFRSLASVSLPMFLFQLGALVINETQTLMIAHRMSLEAVADYAILMRVYALPPTVIGMISGPLQAPFREAYIRGDHRWLTSTFWRATQIRMGIAALGVGFYFVFGNLVAGLMTGRTMGFGWEVWAACGALLFIAIWNVAFNDLLIATGRLWPLVAGILGNGLMTAPLTFLMAKPFGLFGVVAATPAYSLVVTAWLFPWLCRDILRGPKKD